MTMDLFSFMEQEYNKQKDETKTTTNEVTPAAENASTEETEKTANEVTPTDDNEILDKKENTSEVCNDEEAENYEQQIDVASQIREKMDNATEVKTNFNDFDVSEEEKKLENQEEEMKSVPTAIKSAKPDSEKFEPNEFTIIRYFGQDIAVTEYITPEELAEGVLVKKKGEEVRQPITAEILRKRMEKDYPELVASHTELLFIEKKGQTYIVVAIKAKKKGAELVSTDTASAFPLIPYFILAQFIELARLFGEQSYEVHADIYFDMVEKKYLLDVPGQAVHRYWCEVTEDTYSVIERLGMDVHKVAEIHSHHYMRPLPSGQDNSTETVPGMNYVIVGEIGNYFPSITARKFNGFDWDILKVEQLFERPLSSLPHFDGNKISFKKGLVNVG